MTATADRKDLERFRALVARRLGLQFDDGKLGSLAELLRDRLSRAGGVSPAAYLDRLDSSFDGREEWRSLAEQLTVAETYFFRYWDHFRAFAEVVLPVYAARTPSRGEIRILSAGSASGEEAYSLAILVRERLGEKAGSRPIQIVGIDVNPAMIQKALRGRYSAWALRETPSDLRDRYFRADGRDFVLDEAVRSMVTFEERNLVEPDPLFWQAGAFDVVFCRNVTMYFSLEVTRGVIERVEKSLGPEGYLFLGHAETLRGISEGFHLRHTHGTFYYQRREDQEPRLRAAPPKVSAIPTTPVPPAVALLDAGGSWVEAIQRASERIAVLAGEPAGRVSGAGKEPSPPRSGPGSSSPPSRPIWDLGLIVDLLRQERFSDAMTLLSSLPPEAHQDADAQLLRAVILTNAGDLRGAKETCGRILESDELNAGAHYLMALCLEHEGDPRGAVERDQTAAYLDPAFAMPRFHLGLLAKRQGNAETAREELGQALTLLGREEASRILLFGGGFSRDALVELCRSELRTCGGAR